MFYRHRHHLVRAEKRGFKRLGAVAQLGERRVRNAEVGGSSPLGSTTPPSEKTGPYGVTATLSTPSPWFEKSS